MHICKNVLSHIIVYQDVSIALAIIMMVGVQEFQEFNNLPKCVSRTTQRYNEYLEISLRPQNANC
jgi:hypothetical protein